MNCFMGYNPLVAKEVKITTWIKEFDGDSPVYPSFPNDGDCFVVFATDEDALTHNALSKKTYTNGDWADAEGGGGGDFDYPTFTIDGDTGAITCDKTYDECATLCENSEVAENAWFCKVMPSYVATMELRDEDFYIVIKAVVGISGSEVVAFYYLADGTITWDNPK